MKYLSRILFTSIVCILLSSCSNNLSMRVIDADFVGKSNDFTKKLVKGGDFWITTYQRINNKNLPYVFYIEGDGHAFNSKYSISDNPTPAHPMLLKLAALDDRPNVVYIARPCQYTDVSYNSKCNQSYWTDKRMSREVVDSINEVIETLNQDAPLSLIGFSGGGGIAVLIAAQNKHVKDVITLSGNLDHVSFNKFHNARPMLGSLNPIDYATKIAQIPQLHISGGEDKITPPFIADKYVKASNSICVHQAIFNTAKHQKGWEEIWKYILSMPLTCYKS
jgi:pimeloyl-ACP methyl ester carboxylesterase